MGCLVECLLCISFLFMAAVFSIEYTLEITTQPGGYSAGPVFIMIKGSLGELEEFQLTNPLGDSDNSFRPGITNTYIVDKMDVGDVCFVKLRLGSTDGWTVGTVTVWNGSTSMARFPFYAELDDSTVFFQYRIANAVNGKWGTWGEWSPCPAGCNETRRLYRYRFCNNPSPRCGLGCRGFYNESRLCHGDECMTESTTISAEPDYQKMASRLIVVGLLLGLSLTLCVLLAVFLFIVLRDRRQKHTGQKLNSTVQYTANDNAVYDDSTTE